MNYGSQDIQQEGRISEVGSEDTGCKKQLEEGAGGVEEEAGGAEFPKGVKGIFVDITGLKIERLTAVSKIRGTGYWWWRCDCGNMVKTARNIILRGHTKSCGCLSAELVSKRCRKTGLSGSRIYATWVAMQDRCSNPNNQEFKNYGARGIRVCDRWKGPDGFSNFLNDMGIPEPGLSIDRINNDGDYDPANCRWANLFEQNRNKRSNIWLTLPDGRRMILKDAAVEMGIHHGTLLARYRKGTDLFRKSTYKRKSSKKFDTSNNTDTLIP